MAKMSKNELRKNLEDGRTLRMTFGANRNSHEFSIRNGKLCRKHITTDIPEAAWYRCTWLSLSQEHESAFLIEVVCPSLASDDVTPTPNVNTNSLIPMSTMLEAQKYADMVQKPVYIHRRGFVYHVTQQIKKGGWANVLTVQPGQPYVKKLTTKEIGTTIQSVMKAKKRDAEVFPNPSHLTSLPDGIVELTIFHFSGQGTRLTVNSREALDNIITRCLNNNTPVQIGHIFGNIDGSYPKRKD